MNQDDYSEVLTHVRGWMRQTDMVGLDEDFATAVSDDPDLTPSQMVDRYLEALVTHLWLRSPTAIERVGPVELAVTDTDRALHGIDREVFALSELALEGAEVLVEDLGSLRSQLRESVEGFDARPSD